MKRIEKVPIIIKKIQSTQVVELSFHSVESKKLQTTKHVVREIYLRTSFFPKK